MIRNPQIQFASADAIAAFQEERLREEVAYLYENSPYYRRMFDGCGMQPGDIRTTDDLRRLPVTTKTDLQLHPGEFVCVPRNRIIDYVTTSGTLGDPVTFALTEEDLARLAYNEAVSFTTGVPAALGASMWAKGLWRGAGVFNVEEFDPDPFLAELGEQGLPWHELFDVNLEV
mgnify:CR=1 FL=1